jgi:L-seryl-tRNA(Ser) seleniumtransferase
MTAGRASAVIAGGRGAIYRRIGVEPIVNGATTRTILGGSLMPPEVLEAMRQAAECFVDLTELGDAVGRRIAELTRNESAFVSGGASAGLFLSAAVCMARDTPDGVLRLADLDTLPRDFVIQRVHRNPYEAAIELAGGCLVEVGGDAETAMGDLEAALGPSVAGVLFVAGAHRARGSLALADVIRLAHARDIPVIVDAAAQLPPVESLWWFTGAGADIVLFSGGKGLCGPAGTGLVLGPARYVGRFARNAAPLHRVGRPMKVGKEDLVGILAAVESYVGRDHAADARRNEESVAHVVRWGDRRSDVTVVREPTGEAGQPHPRALIRLGRALSGRRDEVLAALREGPPRIELLPGDADSFYVTPETLLAGEEVVITDRLGELLDSIGGDRVARTSRT